MAKIIIHRTSSINARLSGFNIYLNNNKVGKIGNNKTVELEVADGDYELKIGLTSKWKGNASLPITIEGDHVRFFEVGFPKGVFAKQMLVYMFVILAVVPCAITFTMPSRPAGSGLVSLAFAVVGFIGYFWTLKSLNKVDQKHGLHLIEKTKV